MIANTLGLAAAMITLGSALTAVTVGRDMAFSQGVCAGAFFIALVALILERRRSGP